MSREKGYITAIEHLTMEQRERLDSLGVDVSLFSNCYILPGFTDVHVHLREPGFLYKETIATGTKAAAAGGVTQIITMPNLEPCPDNPEHLKIQTDSIARNAVVHTYPCGAITVGEQGKQLADLSGLAADVIAFSDDGRGVASAEMMRQAMLQAKQLGKIIVAHCEDETYPKDSAEAEWKQVERDLQLVRETGCSYHICHVSTKETVTLVRKAKAEGLDVTCETAPHYLTIIREEIPDHGRFKMNPPIKWQADQDALLEAIADGTIDMIATDHAPHSLEEKSKGFAGSAFGIVGLETMIPVLYTKLVKPEIISMERLIELCYINPSKRFGLPVQTIAEQLETEAPTFALWDLNKNWVVDPQDFQTMGRSTPFEGWRLQGSCLLTVVDGSIVWDRHSRSMR